MLKKLLQSNGEYLIVTGKSNQKHKNRYFYKGHFEGYNKELVFRMWEATLGKVWNPDKPDKYGFVVGKHNVDKYIYNIWKNMERRCYYPDCKAFPQYGAKGVTVSEEFKNYLFFEEWYSSMWDGESKLEIDKDVKTVGGCKIYSPTTCILIPEAINTFISTLGEGKGIEEIHNSTNVTYCVHYRRKYKKVNKNFKTFEEASNYKKVLDRQYLEVLLSMYPLNEDIQKSLRNYVEVFTC